jgi:hypothetical protein
MLEDCGDATDTGIQAGGVVKFLRHHKAEPQAAH